MATYSNNTKSNLNLSKNEINRIENALKDQEFVKLLGEYANEIKDPENRKRYEEEITQIETERGMSVVFINPKPGYVLKTKNVSTGSKVFVNICSDGNIGEPSSRVERMSGSQGLQWSIPYSQSQPRQDIDKGGEKCMVYDVIFHPDTLYLAEKDLRLRGVVHSTALDALEKSFDVVCERNNLKFPKMKFKGVFRPTVIRKPVNPDSTPSDKVLSHPSVEELVPEVAQMKVTKPEFSVKFRNPVDLQDHVISPSSQVSISSVRPKEMIIDIKLPLLSSAAGVDLDVQEKSLCLVREEPPKYKLFIDLQYPVDEEAGTARFDKSEKVLVVTLPIKAPPQMIAERLGSNDSGIEVDTGYRTMSQSDDVIMEISESLSIPKEDPIVNDEDFRTERDTFLDEDKSYGFPSYLCSVQKDVIIFTIEVRNVSPDSFLKKVFSDRPAVSFKFSSLGSGFVPIYYAFAVDFLSGGSLDEEKMEVEFWDNNIVVQFPLSSDMREYKVGSSILKLGETLHKVQHSLANEISQKTMKRNKYQTEKHPKAMKTKSTEKDSGRKEKIRHCSGESTDSYMSESPMETIHLEHRLDEDDDDDDDTDGMRTEDSCDEDIQLVGPPRYSRAISEESQICSKPRRGILKKRSFAMVGGRFRCYSESNMDDIGLNNSNDSKLSLAMSEAKISEEDAYSFSSSKKSVSFNEKVQQQYYRINSSIVANTAKNKKKAEKKKRALERRMSEGDAGSLDAGEGMEKKKNNITTSSSFDLSELQAGWEEESHEDSGLSSSYEETILVTSDNSNQVNNNVKQKPKSKRMTKKRSKQIQMANELIFDLDI